MKKSGKTVLLVDDDAPVLRCLSREFAQQPDCKVIVASSPLEALEILRHIEVDVLVTDQRMPLMLGSDLVRHAAELQPGVRRLIVSGSPDEVRAADDVHVLPKPWARDALMTAAFGHGPVTISLQAGCA